MCSYNHLKDLENRVQLADFPPIATRKTTFVTSSLWTAHQAPFYFKRKELTPRSLSLFSSRSLLRWEQTQIITKTCLYNFDLLKPHFYTVKRGLQGYTLFCLFLLKNIECAYSLGPPRRGGSNEYPQSMFWAEIWKISAFLSKNLYFWLIKFPVYLNRHCFRNV